MFGHATLQSGVAATVLARTEPGVAGDLAPITKSDPITDLPINDHARHGPQSARLLRGSGRLQLHRERADLFL